MQRSTPVSRTRSRAAIAGLVVAGLAASGCSWFSKTDELYAANELERPLEVPPELDLPRTDAAMAVPDGSVTASETVAAAASSRGGSTAAATNGFILAGSQAEVFQQVGDALEATEGLEVASRAELLGVFDVNYQSANFLVRVSEVEAGAYVSAVDPRGMPASGAAATQLIALLKAALGGN